eukprot:jgi/Antlo1/707/1490
MRRHGEILHQMEQLKIEKKWKEACYGKLGRKTKEDDERGRERSAIGDVEMSGKETEQKERRPWENFLWNMKKCLRKEREWKTKRQE